jgi:hypothetical protein
MTTPGRLQSASSVAAHKADGRRPRIAGGTRRPSALPAANTRITLGRFAALIGKDRKTVTQHRDRPGFPEPGPDGSYRLGDLILYWNNRTGRRGPSQGGSSAHEGDQATRD